MTITANEWMQEQRQRDLVRYSPVRFLEGVAVRIWMDYGDELMDSTVFQASLQSIQTAQCKLTTPAPCEPPYIFND